MIDPFHWIGIATVFAVGFASAAFALWLFFEICIRDRFHMILFRRGERRLSLASWWNAKIFAADGFNADDWPIGPRPFYLSYRISRRRRLFLMAGTMTGPRGGAVKGRHPEEDEVQEQSNAG